MVTLLSIVTAGACAAIAWRAIRREQMRSDARVALLGAALDESTASEEAFEWPDEEAPATVPRPVLFHATENPAFRRRPLLTAAAGLAVVLSVVVLIAMTGDRHDSSTEAPAAPLRESLELLSMRAARDGSTLAVSGLVRNPSDTPADALTAIVSALDRDGRVVASGTAPLSTLGPGDQSLFVVTIPHVSELARYRVSFRSSTGLVRHVDRRTDPASAAS
ncbi:MAG TPA: FxLYD domain-containing protein [Vicinamibacterales bacterium]|nr:FxLYD domain-containing protein [Vicinamibacterales bacterium]